MSNDLLCKVSALCDGVLPLAGAVAAFAMIGVTVLAI
jgi:hypothetical protein